MRCGKEQPNTTSRFGGLCSQRQRSVNAQSTLKSPLQSTLPKCWHAHDFCCGAEFRIKIQFVFNLDIFEVKNYKSMRLPFSTAALTDASEFHRPRRDQESLDPNRSHS